jgi:hypothetical protein
MFPLSILTYVKAGLFTVVLCSVFYFGYHIGNSKYVSLKQETELLAKTQEAKVESITKQQKLVTKGIQDEYEAKLSAIRSYYKSTSVWNNPSSSKVSGLSTAPTVADVATAYNVLAGQCAETTAQVIELQKWINEQIGIK